MARSTVDNEKVVAFEVGWLAMLTLAACFLRWAHLSQSCLSHFDEGVYVLWGIAGDYPSKEFYAPPLFPRLIGAISLLFDASDWGSQLLSGFFGAATVPVVWWVTRRWFGSTAALASAAMAAFSGFHIAFSRLALTDVTFTFWFIAALGFISELLGGGISSGAGANNALVGSVGSGESRLWLIAAAAGLSAGAALNTKYNGLLVLAIPAAALTLGRLLRWHPWFIERGTLARLVVVVTIAGSLYLPWFWHVQSTYGYRTLLAHHRGYSTGFGQWPDNLWTMFASQSFLDRNTGFVGPVVGLLGIFALLGTGMKLRPLALLAVVGLGGFILGDGLGWTLGLAGFVPWLRGKKLASLLLLTWISTLILLTPLYRPYPRLMLPLVAGGWIAYGGLIAYVVRSCVQGDQSRLRVGWSVASLCCIAGAWMVYWFHARPVREESGTALPNVRSACELICQSVPGQQTIANYVRPPVLYYLYSFAGTKAAAPGDPADLEAFHRWLDDSAGPQWLIVDLALLADNPAWNRELNDARERLREVARQPYRPADAVLLDDFGRGCLAADLQSRIHRTYQLILYHR